MHLTVDKVKPFTVNDNSSLIPLYCSYPVVLLISLDHANRFPLFWIASRRSAPRHLRTQGVQEQARKLLNFCSLPLISQDAILTLLCILRWHAQTAKAFPLLILLILFIFYLVLFGLIVHYSFMFSSIHWIVPRKSLM